MLNPIDPNSTEGRVNERIKNQESNFIFGKGITRVENISGNVIWYVYRDSKPNSIKCCIA